jgi:chaperone modulatory protein CbpM
MNLQMRRELKEAAEICGISPDTILEYISFEWVRPVDVEHQILDEEDVARVRLIWELKERLGVNDEGLNIILHLIDQLNRLHLEIRQTH